MIQKSSAPIHHRNFLLYLQERKDFDGPVLLKELASVGSTPERIDQVNGEYVFNRALADENGARLVTAKAQRQ